MSGQQETTPYAPGYCHHAEWEAYCEQMDAEQAEALEREAAALWRKENPDMSVFACDAEMKRRYRERVMEADRAKQP